MNLDGKVNTVDLTKVIRAGKGSEVFNLLGINKKSADLDGDEETSEKDVEAVVKYMVYEKMETTTVNKIEKPTLEIIEGEKRQKIGIIIQQY